MPQQLKRSFWADFRTGLSGFAPPEERGAMVKEAPAFTLDVRGATGRFEHLNGQYTLRRPPEEINQTWVTDNNPSGFYLMGSMWGWRLQQGEGPDFSSGWEESPTGTFLMRGIGQAEGQMLTAVVTNAARSQ